MHIDVCSFGELWDMPMKRLEKRIPDENPVCNKKMDCHVQPSRQVRKINKKPRIMRKIAMIVMVLYRLVLLIDSQFHQLATLDLRPTCSDIPFDNKARYNASYRYTNDHHGIRRRRHKVTRTHDTDEIWSNITDKLDTSLASLTVLPVVIVKEGEGR